MLHSSEQAIKIPLMKKFMMADLLCVATIGKYNRKFIDIVYCKGSDLQTWIMVYNSHSSCLKCPGYQFSH